MRNSIRDFVRIVTQTLLIPEPIYEFGALQPLGQEGFADIRPFFPGKEYIGCDMQSGRGVDRILNLHNIELPSEIAGSVLILDTLEHVEFVRKAVQEAYRILKPDGVIIATSQMNCPIHAYPQDYWRFTPRAFQSLLGQFSTVFVGASGDDWFPHTVVGIGFKGSGSIDGIDKFVIEYDAWKKRWYEITGKTWVSYVRLYAPGIVWQFYRKYKWNKHKEAARPRG